MIYNRRLRATNLGALVDDYNIYECTTNQDQMTSNVTQGANTVSRNILIQPQLMLEGFYFPQNMLDLNQLSPVANHGCGNSPASTDFYGMQRPSADSKKTRGAIQHNLIERETSIVPSGESESIKMPDAAVYQILIPITKKTMNFSVEVHREADYAGTLPQIVIKQPGQTEQVITDVGAASQFNKLSNSLKPADNPGYVALEIRSNNTATSGSYGTYFGKFRVN